MSSSTLQDPFNALLVDALKALDVAVLKREFDSQNEFIAIENALPEAVLKPLLDALPKLEDRIHRNFIPGHKKGGSISRFDLDQHAPAYSDFYAATALLDFFRHLTTPELKFCPPEDPHTYALYYYTEQGDHIGYHYDTSYYKGQRYTVLLGLVNDSSCQLEYELYRDDPRRDAVAGSLALEPGSLVVFNGDKLWHRISPAAVGERRIALTLEYVTDLEMHPLRRFVSNMKDAIAYFGFRQVFSRSRGR